MTASGVQGRIDFFVLEGSSRKRMFWYMLKM